MKYLLTLASVLLLFSACSKDDSDTADTKASRAVMIYMAGENNLTLNNNIRYLNNDLKEIVEGSKHLTDDQRLFVFVDSLGTDLANKGTPYIMEVHGGQIYTMREFTTDFTCSDPSRFREIVSWMTSNIRMSMHWMTAYNGAFYWNLIADFYNFDKDESLYGCLSMYIPQDTYSYNGGDYQYNKTANNFGWNQIIDWSRFGWN